MRCSPLAGFECCGRLQRRCALDLGDQLSFPRIEEIGVDGTVLAFSLVVSIWRLECCSAWRRHSATLALIAVSR